MTDIKITDLPLQTSVAGDDEMLMIDVSDTTAGPNGTDKKATMDKLKTC